ncbi:unnamed protein product [Phytomonas sp. EM1]|nr:unnamed protein product [Phytomonas sp. EM1]|eukprot:CCW64319.1 unnamed protein product [Phytomonas sp. isolate EM1]
MEEQLRTLSTIGTLDKVLKSVKWDSSHFFEEAIHLRFSDAAKSSLQTQTIEANVSNATTQTNVGKFNQGCQLDIKMNTTSTQTINIDTDLWEITSTLDEKIKKINYETQLILGQVRDKLDSYLLQLNNSVSNLDQLKITKENELQKMEFVKLALLLGVEEEKCRHMLHMEEANEYCMINLQRSVRSEQLCLSYLLEKDVFCIDNQETQTNIQKSSSVFVHERKKVPQLVAPNPELYMLLDECFAVLDDQ